MISKTSNSLLCALSSNLSYITTSFNVLLIHLQWIGQWRARILRVGYFQKYLKSFVRKNQSINRNSCSVHRFLIDQESLIEKPSIYDRSRFDHFLIGSWFDYRNFSIDFGACCIPQLPSYYKDCKSTQAVYRINLRFYRLRLNHCSTFHQFLWFQHKTCRRSKKLPK
jgi:mRNA-degrading endonuclease YafQ of YafQ-DinJ toxin-antitoxin module